MGAKAAFIHATRTPRLVCLGALLLFLPTFLYAQVHGLEVRPADHEVRSEEPRRPVTVPFRIHNGTGQRQVFEARPVMPPQWRLITPEAPFDLAPGETTIRFISFFIPEGTPAGDYPLTYEVWSRQQPAIRDAYTISIQIAPTSRLQVTPVEVPDLVISGDSYQAAFLIRNHGNAPLTVAYSARHSHAAPLEPEAGRLELKPGESKVVEVQVKTKLLEQPEQDWLTFKAWVEEKDIAENVTRPIRILPRVSGYEQRYHTVPSTFSVTGVVQERDGEQFLGWQAELGGRGTLDEAGQRHIDFLFRGPDLRGKALFGRIDEHRLNYWDENLALALGDQVYALSPLTELGRYGRGARGGYHTEQWGVQSYYMQDRFATGAQEEIAFNAHYSPLPGTRFGVNYLNKQGPLAGDIYSIRSEFGGGPRFNSDWELAYSQGNGQGYAARGHVVDSRHPLRYNLTLVHATPEFTGYFRDQQLLFSGFDYPLHERWGFRGSVQFQRQNLNLDPERTAPQRWQTLFGTSYRLQGGTSLNLDYRHWENTDRRTASTFDARHFSLRAGAGQQLGKLRLDANGEWGVTDDQVNRDRFNTALYMASVGWQATQRQSYSAYLFYDDNTFTNVRQSAQSTLGLNANYHLFRSTLLDVNVQQNQSRDRSRYNLNASLVHQLPKGQQLALTARQMTGTLAQTNVMLTYTLPFGLPVGRKQGSATLRGRVFDAETAAGVPDVVLNLNGLIAVSGRDGEFKFPSVKEGIYHLGIEQAHTAFDKIALVDLPLEVQIQGGADNKIEIPLTRGGTLSGQIRRYESAGSPSQNYVMQPVSAPAPEAESKGARQLAPAQGLQNLLVLLSNGKHLHKRLTDGQGRFRLAGIPPGRWTVKVLEEGLPLNHELEAQELVVEIKPGEEMGLEFKVLPKIRKLKMRSPLKLTAR